MNADDLDPMLKHGESTNLEYKSAFPESFFGQKSSKKDTARAEFIRDVAAMANAASEKPGFIIYGFKDHLGKRSPWPTQRTDTLDSAELLQVLDSALDPSPTFEYDEFEYGEQLIGVLRVERVSNYPHVIKKDLGGRIYRGQVFFRRGTSTEIAGHAEIVRMIEGRRPMVLRIGSEELDRVSIDLQKDGWDTSLPVDVEWDRYSLDGYERVAFPGTRRWIESPTGNPAGMRHYLVKRRKTPQDVD